REVNRLRQLDRADVEVCGLRDREEQQVDPHRHRRDEIDAARSLRGQRRADARAGDRDAEDMRVDARAEVEADAVDGKAEIDAVLVEDLDLVELRVEVEVSADPEAARAEGDAAVEGDV